MVSGTLIFLEWNVTERRQNGKPGSEGTRKEDKQERGVSKLQLQSYGRENKGANGPKDLGPSEVKWLAEPMARVGGQEEYE